MSFQLKLLLAMMVLVAGVTTTTLLITENQLRLSYERHFQQTFRFQVDSFLQQREARLEPVKQRFGAGAGGMRVLAAMENAGQPHAEQDAIDDLYQNGKDQLADAMGNLPDAHTNSGKDFFFFP